MDLSTGSMVEEGMAVGIIAAQIDRRAGHAAHDAYVPHRWRRSARRRRERHQGQEGRYRPVHATEGRDERRRPAGRAHAQRRNRCSSTKRVARSRSTKSLPARSCMVEENDEVEAGAVLCEWDPHGIPILAETGGQGPLRRSHRRSRRCVCEKGPVGSHRSHDHGAQGRPASAGRR